MAERRMFAKQIIDSDMFLDMPLSTQALYFHLSMRADDDGFINNPKKIKRMIGASDDDLRVLIAKQFLIPFDSGVVVIKHWRIHNYIRKDTYKGTMYTEEKGRLTTKNNEEYELLTSRETEPLQVRDELVTSTSRERDETLTQVSIGKVSIGKDRIDISDAGDAPAPQKPTKHKYGEYKNVLLSDEELEKLKAEIPNVKEYIERLSSYIASKGTKYKSHYATIRNWYRKDEAERPKPATDEPGAYDIDYEQLKREGLNW